MRHGACTCGAVRYTIDGPVRDVIVCHCNACRTATGAPWAASAARRPHLRVEDAAALAWDATAPSEHDASRGRCRTCGMVVFWDAPDRDTVSFAVATLTDGDDLAVAGHIWASVDPASPPESDATAYGGGWPSTLDVPWHA